MASFPVHLSIAMATGGICATSLLVAGLASPHEVILYFSLATVGGVSPDLDSDNSRPLRIGFELFSLFAASLFMFNLGTRLSVMELCLAWIVVFFTLRYGLFYMFTHFTVHRGIFHSVPAAFFIGFLTSIVLDQLSGIPPLQAWIAGAFATGGYLVHLILDEIYSIDLYGAQIKHSFGTAFKFFAPKSPKASLLLYVALLGVWRLTPDIQPFLSTFSNAHLWQRIESRMLPKNGWLHNLKMKDVHYPIIPYR